MAAKNINKELLIEAVRKLPCLYDTRKKKGTRMRLFERMPGRLCAKKFLRNSMKVRKNSAKVCILLMIFYSTEFRLLENLFF